MPKAEKKLIDDPQRCEICRTVITLYPRSFSPCPHCQKKICRRCWGGAWSAKTRSAEGATAEACAHKAENDGRTMVGISERGGSFQWDWHKALFVAALAALGIGTLTFLFNLFIF